jgi:hypothetical protein
MAKPGTDSNLDIPQAICSPHQVGLTHPDLVEVL